MEFKEINGDLFSAPKTSSIAHCVAADLKMMAGIAVKFKSMFGQVDNLKAQNVKTGGLAVLKDSERYIYYLVTKAGSYAKPTYPDLMSSLSAMKDHMVNNGVKELAMPQIGCGIDGLEWEKVEKIIKVVFQETDVRVTIYKFVPQSF